MIKHPKSERLREIAHQMIGIADNLDQGQSIYDALKLLAKCQNSLTNVVMQIKPNTASHADWHEPSLAHDIDKHLANQLKLEKHNERSIIQTRKDDSTYPYKLEINGKVYSYLVENERNKDHNLVRQIFSRNSQKYSY